MAQKINDFIPFHVPALGQEEEEAVLRVMRSGWITTAKETLAFEQEFSEKMQSATEKKIYSLAVNSATSGLQLAMECCGVAKENPGKILTTPYTFVSTATAACHLGGGVVYADICEDGYNIDPKQIEYKLAVEKDIRAIVPVHIAGLPCNMDEICAIGEKYNVPIIEDAAHAFPSKTAKGYAGTLGDIGVFSFYATKTMTTAEGGMVCTANPKFAERMSIMRMHGIDRPVWNRYTSEKASWEYDVVAPGYKFNLPDILSAIGRVQLAKEDYLYAQRCHLASVYNKAFRDCDFLQLPPDGEGNAWHLYMLRIVPEKLNINRNQFVSAIQQAGIGISMHFIPHFNLTYLKQKFNLNPADYPQTLNRYQTSFSIPIWPGLSEDSQQRIIDTIITLGKNHYVC